MNERTIKQRLDDMAEHCMSIGAQDDVKLIHLAMDAQDELAKIKDWMMVDAKALGRDLYLNYKFTDRGGEGVYQVYTAEDRMRMKHPLGEIRFAPDVAALAVKPRPGHGTG